jgi:hypothetical protein
MIKLAFTLIFLTLSVFEIYAQRAMTNKTPTAFGSVKAIRAEILCLKTKMANWLEVVEVG